MTCGALRSVLCGFLRLQTGIRGYFQPHRASPRFMNREASTLASLTMGLVHCAKRWGARLLASVLAVTVHKHTCLLDHTSTPKPTLQHPLPKHTPKRTLKKALPASRPCRFSSSVCRKLPAVPASHRLPKAQRRPQREDGTDGRRSHATRGLAPLRALCHGCMTGGC